MHSAVQTAVVTIISYKPLSGLNFARYTGQYGSYMPSSPLGVYKPLLRTVATVQWSSSVAQDRVISAMNLWYIFNIVYNTAIEIRPCVDHASNNY